jgi:LPXTG-motif cell wall-anchored protein
MLAVPAILALTAGGLAVSATAANAAPPTLTVTAPTEGQTVDSRTVTFTGTGTDGSTVNVLDTNGDRVPGTTAAVVSGGVWTTTGTYDEDAPVAQTVDVNQVTGGSGGGEVTVDFTLPPAFNFSVTSPTEGETLDSRTVTFTGTGTDGSTVNVLDTNGDRVPGTEAAVVSDGVWTTTGTYADDAPVAQTVNVNQVTGGAGRGEVTVDFTLPPVLIPAPAITSPTNGQTVVGDAVTFTGTGVPGKNILLVVVPTELVNSLQSNAEQVPDNPADPIVVDADGNWTVTLALPPHDYTAEAAEVRLENGVVTDVLSDPSAPVEFILVAATVAPANITPASGTLANTGSAPMGFIGLASLLLAAGAALLITRKKHRLFG